MLRNLLTAIYKVAFFTACSIGTTAAKMDIEHAVLLGPPLKKTLIQIVKVFH